MSVVMEHLLLILFVDKNMIMINFLCFKISGLLLGDVDNIRLSTSMKSIGLLLIIANQITEK